MARVIEVKPFLDTNVIGQAICGAAITNHEPPPIGDMTTRAVVGGDPDPALEWVCRHLGVEVSRYAVQEARKSEHQFGRLIWVPLQVVPRWGVGRADV